MNKKLILAFIAVCFCLQTFAQDVDHETVTYFENFIIKGNKPPDKDVVQSKYDSDNRLIVWNTSLGKGYKFSSEALDKLGYEFVKKNQGDNKQFSKIYRSCSKGIIVEVTEWYNLKYSISIEWYAPSIRQSIGYLMYCSSGKQSDEEIAKGVYDSFKADKINEYKKKTIYYSERKNKPTIIEGTTFLRKYYYEIVQKKNPFFKESMLINLNKNGTKELHTNWQKEIGVEAASYKAFADMIKKELPELIFNNPKDFVFGDSLIPTVTQVDISAHCIQKYLGFIKVNYDSKNSTVQIKTKDAPSDIKTEDLLEYLKDKKDGTYKLSYFNVRISLDYSDESLFKTTFIAYKIYEQEDELTK